jgi:mono/diheme cytochrome c family protein
VQGYVLALTACASGAATVNPGGSVVTTAGESPPAELAAYERARPVFQRHCARCHATGGEKANNKGGALKHFNMDGYPFTGHHASDIGETVREVLGARGEQPSMPRDNPGALALRN